MGGGGQWEEIKIKRETGGLILRAAEAGLGASESDHVLYVQIEPGAGEAARVAFAGEWF